MVWLLSSNRFAPSMDAGLTPSGPETPQCTPPPEAPVFPGRPKRKSPERYVPPPTPWENPAQKALVVFWDGLASGKVVIWSLRLIFGSHGTKGGLAGKNTSEVLPLLWKSAVARSGKRFRQSSSEWNIKLQLCYNMLQPLRSVAFQIWGGMLLEQSCAFFWKEKREKNVIATCSRARPVVKKLFDVSCRKGHGTMNFPVQ